MTNPETKTEKRPPVVVVMGHVDHGKTTLLDYIRKSNVATREAGGITQAVGAYEIEHKGQKVTFIDTPGHQAFTKMRSRGAQIADLAILVVAADDGVKPQTKEAIEILKESKIPYVVAINKIDKNNADIEKSKSDLAQHDVLLEGYGGNISFQNISAQNGEGVEDLLDLLVLASELEELTYDPSKKASGFILEAKRDSRCGNMVTVIIKDGVLRKGDEIKTATACGKVKQLQDFQSKPATELHPSSPAIILGFDELPKAGEIFSDAVETCKDNGGCEKAGPKKGSLNFVLKADVSGCLEALSESIKALTPPEGKCIHIVSEGVGNVSDGDIRLASSTGSIVIAFNVKVENPAQLAAQAQKVRIIESKIIYKILEELEAHFEHEEKGGASAVLEVLAIFNNKNLEKQVIGGKVTEGTLKNKSKIEIRRNGDILGEGKITNLQQKKEEVTEVVTGSECGMLINSRVNIEVGDIVLLKT